MPTSISHELILRIDRAITSHNSMLPLELLHDLSLDQVSRALAVMLETGVVRRGFDFSWLQQNLSECRERIRVTDQIRMLRDTFRTATARRHILSWQQFSVFDYPAATLKLRSDGDICSLGQIIDHYILECRVAAGGTYVVYRGRSVIDGSLVAVKVAQPDRETSPIEWLVRQEVELRRQLKVEGVPLILDVIELDGRPVVIEQWIETVPWEITGSELTLHQKVRILARAARVADRIHQAGFIHGDLSPANILLSDEGEVFITDLNAARQISTERATWLLRGTKQYTPEVRMEADIELDMWSLGLMLDEALDQSFGPLEMGGEPVSVETQRHIALIASDHPLHPLCQIFEGVRVISSCPFLTAGDFADALDAFVDGKPVERRSNLKVEPFSWGFISGET